MGQQAYLKLLFNQEDPGKLSRTMNYFEYMNSAQASRIHNFREVIASLKANETETSKATQALINRQNDLLVQRQQLVVKRRDRLEVLSKLNQKLVGQDARLAQMQADQEALQKVIDHVKSAYVSIVPPNPKDALPKKSSIQPVVHSSAPPPFKPHLTFSKRKGRMSWPSEGKLLARFGSMDSARRQKWDGVVIGAREGDQVQAIHEGRVVFANWLRGYGLMVIVDHGKGFMSLYGRNQSLFKSVGDWVVAGEVIAEVGDTGGFEFSSLYFEIRYKGAAKNPMQWLASAK